MSLTRRTCLAALASAGAPLAAQPAALRLALPPFLSPASLLAAYRPLREHLQRRLAQPVELVTSRDFRALLTATQRAEHDLAQLPAHLARLAMLDWRWQPLPSTVERVTVVVGVRGDGPVRQPADLRGKALGTLDPLSLTATIGRRWLQRQGLEADVQVLALPSINSLLHALAQDEIAAFVAADTQLVALPPGTPRGERVLAQVSDMPGPQFISRPDLPAATLAALQAALLAWQPDPSRPETAVNSLFRPTEPARLAQLDDFVGVARQALAKP